MSAAITIGAIGVAALALMGVILLASSQPPSRFRMVLRQIGGRRHHQQTYQDFAPGDTMSVFDNLKREVVFFRFTSQGTLEVDLLTPEATPEQIAEAMTRHAGLIRQGRGRTPAEEAEYARQREASAAQFVPNGTIPGKWPPIQSDDEYASAVVVVDEYERRTGARSRPPHFTQRPPAQEEGAFSLDAERAP